MEELRSTSIGALKSLRMPSLRNEAYRFCDVSPILRSNLQVGRAHAGAGSLLQRPAVRDAPLVHSVAASAARPAWTTSQAWSWAASGRVCALCWSTAASSAASAARCTCRTACTWARWTRRPRRLLQS